MKRFLAFLLLTSVSFLRAADGWEKLENCRIASSSYFDGDSFHVIYRNQALIIRLYFVDCPETDDSVPGRVAAQAEHFGKTKQETLHIGSYAKQAAAQLLSRRFTVLTRYEDAKGRSSMPRYFGFVVTADGKDLGEILVANGLARSYGMSADPPGRSGRTLRSRYDRLEERAKRQKVGIYSPEPLRAIARAKDSLDDIPPEADPEPSVTPQFASVITPTPPSAPAPDQRSDGKINLNTATQTELEALPGIGPATAQRIIEARPLQSVSDLLKVKGIGESKLNALTEYVTAP